MRCIPILLLACMSVAVPAQIQEPAPDPLLDAGHCLAGAQQDLLGLNQTYASQLELGLCRGLENCSRPGPPQYRGVHHPHPHRWQSLHLPRQRKRFSSRPAPPVQNCIPPVRRRLAAFGVSRSAPRRRLDSGSTPVRYPPGWISYLLHPRRRPSQPLGCRPVRIRIGRRVAHTLSGQLRAAR
jgi:hypothetical protein